MAGTVLVVGLAAAGCAIPTQQGPSTISPSHVPFGLLSPDLPTTSTTQPRLTTLVQVKVYLFAANQQLQAVQRVVDTPAPLASVITALLAGPTASESALGLSTAIPNNVGVISAMTQGNLVTVNFTSAFGQISGTSTELAVSQVVATVAAQNGLATGVVFEIDGARSSVPIASGATVAGPVYLLQFVASPH